MASAEKEKGRRGNKWHHLSQLIEVEGTYIEGVQAVGGG